MRLQKYMAAAGVASRRESERMIAEGRVRVNGEVVQAMGHIVQEGDVVAVNGREIQPVIEHTYILYYKPYGEISSAKDPEGRRTVIDRFAELNKRLYPVGRLDYDTQGLLLITDDGEFMQKLTHPSSEMEKHYLAVVEGQVSEATLKKLREGVVLDDGHKTAPAKATAKPMPNNRTEISLTLHEGRNRQVRRMMIAVGHPVVKLSRIGLSFLTREGLSPGRYRFLQPEEVARLLEH